MFKYQVVLKIDWHVERKQSSNVISDKMLSKNGK